jgi:hypothetical protein
MKKSAANTQGYGHYRNGETGAGVGPVPSPNQERTMKFMLISYATRDWEAGLPPDPRLLAAIPQLSENMPKASALLGTGGLAPSSMGAKARVSGGKVLVTDGLFTETKEILGGYASSTPPRKKTRSLLPSDSGSCRWMSWVPPTRVEEQFAKKN